MRTPPRLLASLLLAFALVLPGLVGPSSAVAAPAPAAPAPPAVKPDPRLIKLTGTDNTRDFATYRTVDGAALNLKVIRSDNLSQLTSADEQKLAGLGLVTVVDLRTGFERTLQPDRRVPGARHYDADVLANAPGSAFDLTEAYRLFVSDPHARAEFARTLRLVSATLAKGRAALFHCSAGKDRTGWTAAMLLTIAGVDRATVDRDYLASNKFRHTSPADGLNGVRLPWLQTSFATADQLFGSFDGYLRNGLRLSAAEIATLRSQLRVG